MSTKAAARLKPIVVRPTGEYWRKKIMMREGTVKVLLLSMFVTSLAGRTGAQSTPGTMPFSDNAGSGSAERTEQQEMRDEVKALRAEVERLRAEVEHRDAASADDRRVLVPSTTGGPSIPSVTPASLPNPAAPAPPGPPAVATATGTSDFPPAKKPKIDPFSDWDWTWLNGNPRTKTLAFDSKFFTPEIRADLNYVYDFNKPKDNSMGGSSELFRSNEIQLEQLGVGGDFHYDNVRARVMTQFGLYSTG